MRRIWRPWRIAAALAALVLVFAANAAAREPELAESPDWQRHSFLVHNLVRARVIAKTGTTLHDYRLDHGRIREVRGDTITLKERDGLVVTIHVADDARVLIYGRPVSLAALEPGMLVTTVMDRGKPAEIVQATFRRGRVPWLARFVLGPETVRLEVVRVARGAIQDFRLDRGSVRAASATSVTLKERDGLVERVGLSPGSRIRLDGRPTGFWALKRGMEATTIRRGDGPAQTVEAFSRR